MVTYDLRDDAHSQSYQNWISLIKEGGVWAYLGGPSYLIESDLTHVELRNKFKNAIDKNDMLYVGAVTVSAACYCYSEEVTKWIKSKL